MDSLRSSAQAHDLEHLTTESLAANRNQSSRCSTEPDKAPALPPAARLLVEQGVQRLVRSRFLASLAQLQPSPRDLDVDVGLRPAWQLFQHPVPADQFGDRQVDRVVPAGGGFWQAC